MMNSTCQILTERQQREREYYDSYCTLHDETPVNFAPIEGVEKRPWNSYWYSYEEVVAHFLDGGRGDVEPSPEFHGPA